MNREGWLTGPVAITGADGHVGRGLQRRLAGFPNRVHPLGRKDNWRAAVEEAEAVIHLAGTLQPRRLDNYRTSNFDTARRLTEALADSPVRRVVFLSYLRADPTSANPYLRAKGEAEDLIRATGVPAVIFRSTFVYGDHDDIGPSFATYQPGRTGKVSVLGDGSQRLAPLHVDDLAGILAAAALDPETPTGVFEVGGPDVVTLDQFVRVINPEGVTIGHLSPTSARFLARVLPSLTPALVDVLLADSVPGNDPLATAAAFGVTLRLLPGQLGEQAR